MPSPCSLIIPFLLLYAFTVTAITSPYPTVLQHPTVRTSVTPHYIVTPYKSPTRHCHPHHACNVTSPFFLLSPHLFSHVSSLISPTTTLLLSIPPAPFSPPHLCLFPFIHPLNRPLFLPDRSLPLTAASFSFLHSLASFLTPSIVCRSVSCCPVPRPLQPITVLWARLPRLLPLLLLLPRACGLGKFCEPHLKCSRRDEDGFATRDSGPRA